MSKITKFPRWTEAELAKFAEYWREVKLTDDEHCPECNYPILVGLGYLKRKADQIISKPGESPVRTAVDGTPDVCYYCHCMRQALTPKEDGRSWLKRSVKV